MGSTSLALYNAHLRVIALFNEVALIKASQGTTTSMLLTHNTRWMDELVYELSLLKVELSDYEAMLLWLNTNDIHLGLQEYGLLRADKRLEIIDKEEDIRILQEKIDRPSPIVTSALPTSAEITTVGGQSVARTSEAIRLREEKENTKDDIEDVKEQINVLMAPVDKLSYENLALGRSIETQMKSLSYTIALINRNDEYFKRDSWEHAMANQPGTTPPYDQYNFVMDYYFLTPDVEAQYVASIPILETSIANDKATATNLIIAHDDLLATVQPDIDTLNALL